MQLLQLQELEQVQEPPVEEKKTAVRKAGLQQRPTPHVPAQFTKSHPELQGAWLHFSPHRVGEDLCVFDSKDTKVLHLFPRQFIISLVMPETQPQPRCPHYLGDQEPDI